MFKKHEVLLFFCLFSFVVYCKTGPGQVLPPCGSTNQCKTKSMHMCDLLQKSDGARTILVTKFVSRVLYADSSVRIKTKVYFGLKMQLLKTMLWPHCCLKNLSVIHFLLNQKIYFSSHVFFFVMSVQCFSHLTSQ